MIQQTNIKKRQGVPFFYFSYFDIYGMIMKGQHLY